MLFCLDVGNSQIFGGIYDNGALRFTFRRTATSRASSDEYGIFFRTVLRENGVDPAAVRRVAICSVVPGAIHSLRSCFLKYFHVEPFLLQPGVKTGLRIRYRNPLEVGADKIANAIGAMVRYPRQNLIVVDFGTATTLCAISAEGDYLGGIITPGLNISVGVLDSSTARLPAVEIRKPESVLGRSTTESIQSGLYYGTVATVRTLAAAITEEQFGGRRAVLIGTGGFGALFQEENLFDEFIPGLSLLGLHHAVDLAQPDWKRTE